MPEKISFTGRRADSLSFGEVEFPLCFLSKDTQSVTAGPEWNSWLKVGTVMTKRNYEQLMQRWEK